ncbi:LUD domain-containing protein [bacterium]|nr:LUD domain-containing protein [candidate division CSSED10-310 bacterium]
MRGPNDHRPPVGNQPVQAAMTASDDREEILRRLRSAGDNQAVCPNPAVAPAHEDVTSPISTAAWHDLTEVLEKRCEELGTVIVYPRTVGELDSILVRELGRLGGSAFIEERGLCRDLNLLERMRLYVRTVGATALSRDAKGRFTLAGVNAAVTSCDLVIAAQGTVVIGTHTSDRLSSVLPHLHMVLFQPDQVVRDIDSALRRLRERPLPAWVGFITGSSCTADIEKTLVRPAHGAARLVLCCCRF